MLERIFGEVDRIGVFVDWPEILRIKGEVLLVPAQVETKRAVFGLRSKFARTQEAKEWELRATVGLARLFAGLAATPKSVQSSPKSDNWFTEGFDTADLKDAKALLIELSDSA